jgi:hypothetical protein
VADLRPGVCALAAVGLGPSAPAVVDIQQHAHAEGVRCGRRHENGAGDGHLTPAAHTSRAYLQAGLRRGAKRRGCHAQQVVVDQQRSADIRTHIPSNTQSASAGGAVASAPLAAPPPRRAPVVAELHAGKLAGEMPLDEMARSVLQIELPRRDDVEVCNGAQSSNSCAARQNSTGGEGWRGAAPSTAPLTTGCEK